MMKKTMALILAAVLMTGAACAETAPESGAFATLAQYEDADPRLAALDKIAEPLAATLTVPSGVTVEICQAYYEGYRVYISYRISPVTDLITLHEGAPEGVTEWDHTEENWIMGDLPAAYPDIRKQNEWLDGKGQRWVEMPYCGLMDGIDLPDGNYADIIAGNESREADGTIVGWKECVVPEKSRTDPLTFDVTVASGTTIRFQDGSTYKEKYSDPEKSEILFTLKQNEAPGRLQGRNGQAAAELTMGQIDITGVVSLASPEQAAAWLAMQEGEEGNGADVILYWSLYQNGTLVSEDLYGATSVPESGEGVVFDVMFPRLEDLGGLTLVPVYAEAGEKPEEAVSLENV